MRRRRARAVAGVFFAAGVVTALLPAGAGADSPEAAAYWMRSNPTAVVPAAEPNPAVPDGGLFVDNDPSTQATTPAAFSAVRFGIPEGATGKLTLKITPSSASTPQTASLSACPTTSPWSPPAGGGPGPYDKAPTYTTSAAACVVAQPSADGKSYTFTLGHEQEGRPGAFDLAIVPTPASNPVPFTMVFDKPDDGALAVDPMPEDTEAEATEAPAAPAAPEPPPDPVADPLPSTSTPDLGAATPVFAAPSLSQSSLPTASVMAAPAEPAAPATAAPTKAAPSRPATVPAVHVSDKQWQRLMAVSLLLTMAVALWYIGGQPARAPRLIGSVASTDMAVAAAPAVPPARTGGIGRFAKPRTGPPRRLT